MTEAIEQSGAFSTTHWSIVQGAGQDYPAVAAVALERLCSIYWSPVYAFIRRRGSDPHEAEDLTQAFFAHLLEKEALKKVSRQKGKFRSFLLASVANFLTNEWDKRQTLKRGGQNQIISLDEMAAEELYSHEPDASLTPENLFERRWAFTLMDQVLARLKEEYLAANKAKLFAKLEPGLTGEINPGLYAEWAAALGHERGRGAGGGASVSAPVWRTVAQRNRPHRGDTGGSGRGNPAPVLRDCELIAPGRIIHKHCNFRFDSL